MFTPLQKRCIELAYRNRLSHISSALNTTEVLREIYDTRNPDDPVVLGNSHAALALYVVLESRGLCDATEMVEKHGTHAARDLLNGIYVSGGSLGQAETVAVGMAIGDRSKTVYLVTSDGAMAEGAVWEALGLVKSLDLSNLEFYVIANGYGAYHEIDQNHLLHKISTWIGTRNLTFICPPLLPLPWLRGLQGHYIVMDEAKYNEAMTV